MSCRQFGQVNSRLKKEEFAVITLVMVNDSGSSFRAKLPAGALSAQRRWTRSCRCNWRI